MGSIYCYGCRYRVYRFAIWNRFGPSGWNFVNSAKSYQNSHFLHIEDKSNGKHKIKMTLAEEVTFFNKGAILKELDSLPRDTYLEIDLIKTRYLDHDIIEILEDFLFKAQERNIDIKLVSKRGVVENPSSFIKFFNEKPKSKLSLS